MVQAAVELCWLTCVSSELNGAELTRSGGVDSLGRLLQRCLAVMPRDAAPTLPAAVISRHCLRTFAGMASFADAREQLHGR
jgi:DnaJ family protein C protein 13